MNLYWQIAYHVQRLVGHWTLDMLASALIGAAALRLRHRKLRVTWEAVPPKERTPLRRTAEAETPQTPDNGADAAFAAPDAAGAET